MPSNRPAVPRNLRDDFAPSPARDAIVAVVRAYGTVQRLMEPYFTRFGLTPPQFQLLTIANRLRHQPLTQRRLARELYVSFPNVTVMLARLGKAGLIERRSNPADRRENFVALTDRARTLLRRIWKVHQRQLDRVMAGLTRMEQTELARLLNRMIAAHHPSAEEDGLQLHR
jgi:DNA-binding MarR family transcriptional regulator